MIQTTIKRIGTKRFYTLLLKIPDNELPGMWAEIEALRKERTIYHTDTEFWGTNYRLEFSNEIAALEFYMRWTDDVEFISKYAHDEWGNRLPSEVKS